jgi:hypothetical protein
MAAGRWGKADVAHAGLFWHIWGVNRRWEWAWRTLGATVLATGAAVLWRCDYPHALAYLHAALDAGEKAALLESAFTPQKYAWLRWTAILAPALAFLLPIPSFSWLREPLWRIRDTWRGMPISSRAAFGVLMTVWAARNAYFIARFPITMDEANVYLTFVRRGPLVIASYYPIPSNHIFHTLTMWATTFWAEGVWAVRLSACVATGLTAALIYFWVRRERDDRAAMGAAGTFLFAFAPTLYGVLGRGYAFLALFTLLLFYAETTNRRTLSVFSAALGWWTAPLFVYPAVAAALYFRRPGRMFVAGAVAALLYAPVFLAGGNLTSFYSSPSPARNLAHLPDYLPYVAEFLSPLRMLPDMKWISISVFAVFLAAVLAAATNSFSTKIERRAARFSLLLLALMLIPVVQPPDKAFIVWWSPAAVALGRWFRTVYWAPALWLAASLNFVPVFSHWYEPDCAAYRKFISMPPAREYVARSEAEFLAFSFYAPPGTRVVYHASQP